MNKKIFENFSNYYYKHINEVSKVVNDENHFSKQYKTSKHNILAYIDVINGWSTFSGAQIEVIKADKGGYGFYDNNGQFIGIRPRGNDEYKIEVYRSRDNKPLFRPKHIDEFIEYLTGLDSNDDEFNEFIDFMVKTKNINKD